MNALALAGLLTGLSSFSMGMFVLCKDKTRKLNKLWFFFTLSVGIWGSGVLWIALEQIPSLSLLAWRITFAFGVLWIPILFYHFAFFFCELKQKKILVINYAIGIVSLPFILFSPLFFGGVRFVFASFYYSVPGSLLFHIFFIWWIWLVLYAHYQVFVKYRYASGIKRNQLKYFLIAFSFAFSTGALDYLPIYGIDLYPYGTFGVAAYPLLTTYAIIKYRLMDIATVIHKTISWVATSSILLLPVAVCFWAFRRHLESLSDAQFFLLILGTLSLMIPYIKIVQPRIDHHFQRRKYDVQKVLQGMVKELALLKDLTELTEKIAATIREAMYVSHSSIILWEKKRQDYLKINGPNVNIDLSTHTAFLTEPTIK